MHHENLKCFQSIIKLMLEHHRILWWDGARHQRRRSRSRRRPGQGLSHNKECLNVRSQEKRAV